MHQIQIDCDDESYGKLLEFTRVGGFKSINDAIGVCCGIGCRIQSLQADGFTEVTLKNTTAGIIASLTNLRLVAPKNT